MRTILICTVGSTPAVLTEAVWALVHHEHIVPDEVVALTTENCIANVVESYFSPKKNGWGRLLSSFKRNRILLKDKLVFDESRVCSARVEDLKAQEDNLECAECLYQYVRKYVCGAEADDTRVIFVLSGGRKTLCALATSVMSLLGRPEDRLVHVMVEDRVAYQKLGRDFLFPEKGCVLIGERGGRVDAAEIDVSLFDVPFVRTRGLLRGVPIDKIRTFEECLQMTQECVLNDCKFPMLSIDMNDGTVRNGVRSVKMDPVRLVFLWMIFRDKVVDRSGKFLDSIKKVAKEMLGGGWVALPSWFRSLCAKLDKDNVPECRQIIQGVKNDLEKNLRLSPLLLRKLIPHGRKSLSVYNTMYPDDKLVVKETEFSEKFYRLAKDFS